MNQYLVSDTKDKDLPIMVGTAKEIKDYFGTTEGYVRCAINKKQMVRNRYLITKLEVDNERD